MSVSQSLVHYYPLKELFRYFFLLLTTHLLLPPHHKTLIPQTEHKYVYILWPFEGLQTVVVFKCFCSPHPINFQPLWGKCWPHWEFMVQIKGFGSSKPSILCPVGTGTQHVPNSLHLPSPTSRPPPLPLPEGLLLVNSTATSLNQKSGDYSSLSPLLILLSLPARHLTNVNLPS